MKRQHRTLALVAAALLIPGAGWTADTPTPAANDAAAAEVAKTEARTKAKTKEPECVNSSSRIRRDRTGKCLPPSQPTRSITKDEIDSTGQIDTAEALKRLDPRFH